MPAAKFVLGLLAVLGHAAFWVGLNNRAHATALPRWMIKSSSLACYTIVAIVGIVLAAWLLAPAWSGQWIAVPAQHALNIYSAGCAVLATVHLVRWLYERSRWRRSDALLDERTSARDIAGELGYRPVHGAIARLLARLPGNELLKLHAHERVLRIDRLPAQLEGLSLLHLSDLHFSGRVGKPFFEQVVEAANRMESDLVVLTGDVCDAAAYIDWVVPILGRVKSRYGKFFVLGNHDLRVRDTDRLRRSLEEAGYVDLGGRWRVIELQSARILVAGNELPWIAPAADLSPHHAPLDGTLRVLLAHSPDQFDWARAFDFDLMLAGHTHGGQIRLPVVGSVLCPSWFGTRYACGTFRQESTVMHVSRGISSLTPVRLNCPPEIIKLVLTGGHAASSAAPRVSETATA